MGFIGSNLVPYLLNKGHEVIGFDNLVNPSLLAPGGMKEMSGDNWSKFKFYECDIRSFRHMRSICLAENPDVIVHLAAVGSVPKSFDNPEMFIDVNELGFMNMIKLSKTIGKRLVFASSSSVYGDNTHLPKTEGHEGNALSPYALTKQNNERMAKLFHVEHIGLRFFNVYGPGQRHDSEYSAVIPKWLSGDKIYVNGNGDTVRDYTYVMDVCMAIDLSINSDNSGFVVNVGTGQETSLTRLSNMLSQGRTVIHRPKREGEVLKSVASTEKAEKLLGFVAETSLEDGLKKTAKFYQGLIECNFTANMTSY
jgi:UDP-N-acetylglucosamine 4-epimerase